MNIIIRSIQKLKPSKFPKFHYPLINHFKYGFCNLGSNHKLDMQNLLSIIINQYQKGNKEYALKTLYQSDKFQNTSQPIYVAINRALKGLIFYDRKQNVKAVQLFEEALKLFYLLDSSLIESHTKNWIIPLHMRLSEYYRQIEKPEKIIIHSGILVYYYNKTEGETHRKTLSARFTLGQACRLLNQYAQSIEHYQFCIKHFRSQDQTDKLIIWHMFNGLYNSLMHQAKYQAALSCLKQCQKICLEYKQPNQQIQKMQIVMYANFGTCYSQLYRFSEAIESLQKSKNMKIRIKQSDDIEYCQILCSLGICYGQIYEWNTALQIFQQALKIQVNKQGEDGLTSSSALTSIARVLFQLGNIEKSLQTYRRAESVEKKNNKGPKYETITGIGYCLLKLKQYQVAKKAFEHALQNSIKRYGEKHPQVASSYYLIGKYYQALGQRLLAEEFYLKSLKMINQLLGENNYASKYCVSIGQLYIEMGKVKQAQDYLQKALEISVKVYGSDAKKVKEIEKKLEELKNQP